MPAATARDTSPFSPAWAAGRGRLPTRKSIRGCARGRWDTTAPHRICRLIPAAAARCWCSRCPARHRKTNRTTHRSRAMRNLIKLAVPLAALTLACSARAEGALRVCADPNNLPFSNSKGEGFENKLAELVAGDLREALTYTWTGEQE